MRLVSSYSIALLMMALCAAAGTAAARYLPDNGVFKGASVNARKTLQMVGSPTTVTGGSMAQTALNGRNPMAERIVVASSTKWPANASRQSSATGGKASD